MHLRILSAIDVPRIYEAVLNNDTPERDLALKKSQMQNLRVHFQKHFKDPRRDNRTYYASSLLVSITMALFAGRSTLTFIQRYGESALYHFLTQIEPEAFSQCLNAWFASNLGTLPRALAVDGKWIRERALSLCLSDHETGAPVAIGFAAQVSKTDENKARRSHHHR